MRIYCIVPLLLFAASCGLNSTAHCDIRPKESRCQERDGIFTTVAAFKQTCGLGAGKAGDGACPREGVIGGCDLSDLANPVRDWYYSDPARNLTTADHVKTKCDGMAFLAP